MYKLSSLKTTCSELKQQLICSVNCLYWSQNKKETNQNPNQWVSVFHIIMIFPSFISNQPTRAKHKGRNSCSPSLSKDAALVPGVWRIAESAGSALAEQWQRTEHWPLWITCHRAHWELPLRLCSAGTPFRDSCLFPPKGFRLLKCWVPGLPVPRSPQHMVLTLRTG